MNLKPGMNILPSSYYTRYKLRVLPTSGMGGMSTCVDHVQIMPFYAPLWRLMAHVPLGTGGLLRLLMLDLRSRRPKLLTNN